MDWNGPIKPVTEIKPKSLDAAIDLRDEDNPCSVCVCGADLWIVYAKFDEGGMSAYFLDIQCANCGSMATAPTPKEDVAT
jgi:hypothetical protein